MLCPLDPTNQGWLQLSNFPIVWKLICGFEIYIWSYYNFTKIKTEPCTYTH